MSALTVEQRLAMLEAEVANLKKRLAGAPVTEPEASHAWLDKIYGAFAGDPHFKEAMELGRKYRESLRPKPRKKQRKRNHGHS